jgi:hypothetical protein
MFEYTQAFLKPFKWAQRLYASLLSGEDQTRVEGTVNELLDPITASAPPAASIRTAADWNSMVREHQSTIQGIYTSVDAAEKYAYGLKSTVQARVGEAFRAVRSLATSLDLIKTLNRREAHKSTVLMGGDYTLVDTSPENYYQYPLLASDSKEGCFRLGGIGSYSVVRTGQKPKADIFLERTIGSLFEQAASRT